MVQRTKYTEFPDFLEFIPGWSREKIDKINESFVTYNQKVDALEKNQPETDRESVLWAKSYFSQHGQRRPPCSRFERGREPADSWA